MFLVFLVQIISRLATSELYCNIPTVSLSLSGSNLFAATVSSCSCCHPKMKLLLMVVCICCCSPPTSIAAIISARSFQASNSTLSWAIMRSSRKSSPALAGRAKRLDRSRSTVGVSTKTPPQKSAKAKQRASPKPECEVYFSIHVPEQVPFCTTCEQRFGEAEKDLLPEQTVSLKWRTFTVKEIDQVIIGLCKALIGF